MITPHPYRAFTVVVVLVLSTFHTESRADYMGYGLKVTCDAKNNKAEIVPYAVWNEDVYVGRPSNCTLSNGTEIRAKLGLGPVFPYGMGGGDPAKWLSVWINKTKIVSRYQVGCEDEGPCNGAFKVAGKRLFTCALTSSPSTNESGLSKKASYKCTSKPIAKLAQARARDAVEYPLAGERMRPSPGTFVTLFARDAEFCRQFLSDQELPENSEEISPLSSSAYEYSGSYNRLDFDINNDGENETVLGLNSSTHYRDGDIFFIYAGSTIPAQVGNSKETSSESRYAKLATRILPHYWADYTNRQERLLADKNTDSGAYELKNSKAPWWDTHDVPVFRFRYWHLVPFRNFGTTYFRTRSMEAGLMHWSVVLRPEPDFKVTEECVFQTVQEHY